MVPERDQARGLRTYLHVDARQGEIGPHNRTPCRRKGGPKEVAKDFTGSSKLSVTKKRASFNLGGFKHLPL